MGEGNMKQILTALALAASSAGAQITTNVTAVDKYVARGMEFGKGAMQPSIKATHGPLAIKGWFTKSPYERNSELDVYATLGAFFGDSVRVEAAYGKMKFWNSELPETQEVQLNVSQRKLSAQLVHDWRKGKGQYAEAAYEDTAKVSMHNREVPLVIHVATGFNRHYFKPHTSFSHIETTLKTPFTVKGIKIVPQATYIRKLASDYKNTGALSIGIEREF
jgi:hypothetical protein